MSRVANQSLDRKLILASAFELLELEGLAGLSMRALASRLGVQAPAIYWHVSGKDELLGLMAAHIQRSARDVREPTADWREWLFAYGQQLHHAYLSHRDGAWLCANATPPSETAGDTEHIAEDIAAPLVRLGVAREAAISMQASVISLTLGWSIYETNSSMHRLLSEIMDFKESYERGLRALVVGFAPTAM